MKGHRGRHEEATKICSLLNASGVLQTNRVRDLLILTRQTEFREDGEVL